MKMKNVNEKQHSENMFIEVLTLFVQGDLIVVPRSLLVEKMISPSLSCSVETLKKTVNFLLAYYTMVIVIIMNEMKSDLLG